MPPLAAEKDKDKESAARTSLDLALVVHYASGTDGGSVNDIRVCWMLLDLVRLRATGSLNRGGYPVLRYREIIQGHWDLIGSGRVLLVLFGVRGVECQWLPRPIIEFDGRGGIFHLVQPAQRLAGNGPNRVLPSQASDPKPAGRWMT